MTDEPVSLYLLRETRELCPVCQESPQMPNRALCKECYRAVEDADRREAAQGNVLDLVMEGKR